MLQISLPGLCIRTTQDLVSIKINAYRPEAYLLASKLSLCGSLEFIISRLQAGKSCLVGSADILKLLNVAPGSG
jgi:hypothetical protein